MTNSGVWTDREMRGILCDWTLKTRTSIPISCCKEYSRGMWGQSMGSMTACTTYNIFEHSLERWDCVGLKKLGINKTAVTDLALLTHTPPDMFLGGKPSFWNLWFVIQVEYPTSGMLETRNIPEFRILNTKNEPTVGAVWVARCGWGLLLPSFYCEHCPCIPTCRFLFLNLLSLHKRTCLLVP